MEPIKNIPVLLLTGYLGSGKTTLLNRILKNQEGIKFAVIVNDIGEVNIDADLIEKGGVVGQKDDSLVALQNGCICCTLKMDLVEQLRDITRMHRFDYIVIEASGICEPAPIAQTIINIPSLGPDYVKDGYLQLDCIVTVVDALRMRDEFKNGNDLMRKNIDEEDIENLVIQQIEFCNIILLNKASEVSKEELAEVKQIIRAIQPKADIIECDYGNIDLNQILHTEKFNFEEVATSATWIHELEHDHDDDDDDDDEHEHHHHDDDDDDEHEHHHEHEHEHHHHHHHDDDEEDEHHHHHHDHDDDDEDEHEHHHHHHHHHGEHDADEIFDSWGIETARKYSSDELSAILDSLGNEEKFDITSTRRVLISYQTHPITDPVHIDIDVHGLLDAGILEPEHARSLPEDPSGSPCQVTDAWFSETYLNILVNFTGKEADKHTFSVAYTVDEENLTFRLGHDGSQDTEAGNGTMTVFLCIPMYEPALSFDQYAQSTGQKPERPIPVQLQWTARTLEGGPLTLQERKGSYQTPAVN